jgi:hypothetical protein
MHRLLVGFSPAELEAMRTTIDALDREVQRLDRPGPSVTVTNERTPA